MSSMTSCAPTKSFACLAALLCSAVSTGSRSSCPVGSWVGQLSYRGDDIDVRVHLTDAGVEGDSNRIDASLDIPALVYAGQSMPTRCGSDGRLTLEFPFGIGEFSVAGDGEGRLLAEADGTRLELRRGGSLKFSATEITFGARGAPLAGTLFLPSAPSPSPVAFLLAGSGNAARSDWSYSSWADFYLRQGVGVFIYDRRRDLDQMPDGSLLSIDDHTADVLDGLQQVRSMSGVDEDRVGLVGHSRGAWIAMSAASSVKDLAFLLLLSPAAMTPAEQEATSVLTGMRQDGLDDKALASARTYLRLYFFVASTGQGWDLLASIIDDNANSSWLQYVDQPQGLADLAWWNANMDFDAVARLENIDVPTLALWGGADFITPFADNQARLVEALSRAGNEHVQTHVFDDADHRLEVGFGEDENGQWRWFGLAPGALTRISNFVQRMTGE